MKAPSSFILFSSSLKTSKDASLRPSSSQQQQPGSDSLSRTSSVAPFSLGVSLQVLHLLDRPAEPLGSHPLLDPLQDHVSPFAFPGVFHHRACWHWLRYFHSCPPESVLEECSSINHESDEELLQRFCSVLRSFHHKEVFIKE